MLFWTRYFSALQRTQLIYALRAHLAEHGVIAPQGIANSPCLAKIIDDEEIVLARRFFFGLHLVLPGLSVILSLVAVAILFMVRAHDTIARWCFAPYAVWLGYASALNGAIFAMN